MLDLNFVRGNLPLIERKLRDRGMNPEEVLRDFSAVDARRREHITNMERLRALQNKASEEIARRKREKQDASAQMAEMRLVREQVAELEKQAAVFEAQLQDILKTIPNLPHESVPLGHSAEENVEVRRWGAPPKFDFAAKPHWELGAQLGVLDLERAVKLTGARFAVYWDLGARMERVLANFMLDLHTREHGYTEVLPPFMVNADSLYGTGNLPKFEADLFKVPTDHFEQDKYWTPKVGELVLAQGKNGMFRVEAVDLNRRTADIRTYSPIAHSASVGPPDWVPWSTLLRRRDLYLIPTAEVPVTNLFRDEVLDAARLPVKLTAWTPCFRSEAGSYGKDVRGIIRQHQFQKVELVKFARPDTSYDELESLTGNAEEVLKRLGLHYRVVALSAGDMGFSAAKTYDIEVWLPGQELFREISSCSNFESYQARRANIRWRPEGKGKTEFVHTLNGSGLAIGRTWLAILENYQQADGSVVIPEALRPYMGTDRITPRKL